MGTPKLSSARNLNQKNYHILNSTPEIIVTVKDLKDVVFLLPAMMEAQGDTLCLLAQPKEGQQQI